MTIATITIVIAYYTIITSILDESTHFQKCSRKIGVIIHVYQETPKRGKNLRKSKNCSNDCDITVMAPRGVTIKA